jgi:anti-sigma regulatory factor (Ser/Thr protein kinase)
LSPDRKIYQQFRLESDKLVVTVSSRGVVPASTNGQKPPLSAIGAPGDAEGAKGRRGWGLQLIQSLMDEVEFETVDDGTRLKMTKYVKKG